MIKAILRGYFYFPRWFIWLVKSIWCKWKKKHYLQNKKE